MKYLNYFAIACVMLIFMACGTSYDSNKCEDMIEKIRDAESIDDLSESDFNIIMDQYLAIEEKVKQMIDKCKDVDDLDELFGDSEFLDLAKYEEIFSQVMVTADQLNEVPKGCQSKLKEVMKKSKKIEDEVSKKVEKIYLNSL